MLKTYSPKPSQLEHNWYLVDASGLTLGRLATTLATYLMGKHKPQFSAHLDCGDNMVVINVEKIHVTGKKLTDKKYYRYSGYPGGIYETSLQDQLKKDPKLVLEHAVAGMIPKNRLTTDRMARLKLHVGSEHTHDGQKPTKLEVK